MKTFEELKTGGTLPEILAYIALNTKGFDKIKADAAKRETKAYTAEDVTEMTRLDTESEELQAKAIEMKRVFDMEARNTKRAKDLNEPVNRVPFGGDDDENKAIVQVPFSGNLKHITGTDRKDAELKAYRLGQFILAGMYKRQSAWDWCQANGVEIRRGSDSGEAGPPLKAMNEAVNEQGGVLVPEEFDSTLIRLIEQYGVFRPNTTVVPMGSDVRNEPRRTGGLTAYWVGEGKIITGSTPAYDNVKLVAKKLAALAVHSTEISEDSVLSIADQLAFEIGYAFAQAEDDAGFNGDGTSTYGGITGVRTALTNLSATIANIAGLFVGAGNNYSELTLADFENTIGIAPAFADTPQARWYAHKTFYWSVMKRLELAAGGVTAAEVATGGMKQPMFLGYPVVFSQKMPRVEANSQVVALWGDLGLASMMGDRRRITLFTDPYSLSNYDQVQIRGTERIDIVVHDVGNASATASLRVPGPVTGLIMAAA